MAARMAAWFGRGGSSRPHQRGRVSSPRETLERPVGPLGRVVVLDCETTGLNCWDRVVGFALMTVGSDGRILSSWESLLNSRPEVESTSLNGITGAAVADALELSD